MLVILSDLDGTLLDRSSYSFEPAREALDAVERLRIPLVLSTSKTRAELQTIRQALANHHPSIAENGAIVSMPSDYFPVSASEAFPRDGVQIAMFGSPYSEVVHALHAAAHDAQAPVRGFADMSAAEVAGVTGLPIADAALAKLREHDEPFLILDSSRADALLSAIESRGKHWTRGGRFYHISDRIDKGLAAGFLRRQFQARGPDPVFVGLGDAPNDIPLLSACDLQVIIGTEFAVEMRRALPGALLTERSGPAAWNDAVLAVLSRFSFGASPVST